MAKASETGLKKSNRNLGIELLRIISTFMVIILHTLGSSSIHKQNTGTLLGSVLWLFEILCYCAVNCFAMTSGYVSCKSRFKISRLLNLWFQVTLISVISTVLLGLIAPEKVETIDYINMFLPILSDHNWYFTAFFGLSLFSPFLNLLMQNMTKNQHKYLLALIFVLFSVFSVIPDISDLFHTNKGYSLLWLASMYIVGGYIRLHGVSNPAKKHRWLIGYFLSSGFVWLWYVLVYDVTKHILSEVKYAGLFLKYTSPFIVFAAICLLKFFSSTSITKGSKFICTVSSLTFGVFIFHTQDLYWDYGLKAPVAAIADKGTLLVILGVLLIALATFVICGVASYLLMLLFKVAGINKFCDFVQNKLFCKASAMLESNTDK